jgi:hypothetical protein
MSVVDFPPRVTCERCLTPMRRATPEEIHADSVDHRYRKMARMAAQGRREFEVDEEFALPNREGIIEGPTWLLRCDSCGLRLLWNRVEEE